MKLSYEWLSSLVSGVPKPAELARRITMHAFQVEGIERAGSDAVLDIDILPNRMSDAASHIGVARDISAILGRKLSLPVIKKRAIPKLPPAKLSVRDLTKGAVPAYCGVLLEGVSIQPSPGWVQKRLEAAGIRAINNVVDVTNYVMLESGQPLHAFDYEKIQGRRMTIRASRKGEKITTLDGVERALPQGAIIIEDEDGIMDLAGIMGGAASSIDTGTTVVFLHSAVFDRRAIRNAEQALRHRTEASLRYTYGVYPEGAEPALDRATDLLIEWSGKKIRPVGRITLPLKAQKRVSLSLRLEYVASLLGIAVPEKQAIEILLKLGFMVSRKGRGVYAVRPPLWRPDITNEEDVIEEIGRIFGFERIAPKAPVAHLEHPEENEAELFKNALADQLVSLGFQEIESYALEPRRAFPAEFGDDWRIELANPMSEEFACMRDSLVRGLIEAVRKNAAFAARLKFFEIGRIFRAGAKGPEERDHATIVLAGASNGRELYYEAKGVVESLCECFGVADPLFEDIENSAGSWPVPSKTVMHPFRAALIRVGNATVGALYQVHPAVQGKPAAVAIDLLVPECVQVVEREFEFRPIPRFPAVVRDLAILVPRDERAQIVEDIIEAAGGELLADTEFFDYYEGDAIGEDQKSLAFHLVFQSANRTLRDEEVAQAIDRVLRAIREQGWEVRT